MLCDWFNAKKNTTTVLINMSHNFLIRFYVLPLNPCNSADVIQYSFDYQSEENLQWRRSIYDSTDSESFMV